MHIITPTVGRKVYYFGNPAKHSEPWDATIIKIVRPEPDEQGCRPPDVPTTPVNLLVVHPDTGTTYFEPAVVVGDESTEGRHYRWMDWQKRQAHREAFVPEVGSGSVGSGEVGSGQQSAPLAAAITQLGIAAATCENNAPIHAAEGNAAQASLSAENAASYRTAIGVLQGTDAEAPRTGTVGYADGTTATGTLPLPDSSPTADAAA